VIGAALKIDSLVRGLRGPDRVAVGNVQFGQAGKCECRRALCTLVGWWVHAEAVNRVAAAERRSSWWRARTDIASPLETANGTTAAA